MFWVQLCVFVETFALNPAVVLQTCCWVRFLYLVQIWLRCVAMCKVPVIWLLHRHLVFLQSGKGSGFVSSQVSSSVKLHWNMKRRITCGLFICLEYLLLWLAGPHPVQTEKAAVPAAGTWSSGGSWRGRWVSSKCHFMYTWQQNDSSPRGVRTGGRHAAVLPGAPPPVPGGRCSWPGCGDEGSLLGWFGAGGLSPREGSGHPGRWQTWGCRSGREERASPGPTSPAHSPFVFLHKKAILRAPFINM